MTAYSEARAHLAGLIAEQAADEGLWFFEETAPEAYLQQELRRLHASVEELLELESDAVQEALEEVNRQGWVARALECIDGELDRLREGTP